MPARVRTVALRGVRHGATLALDVAQLCSDHDLHLVEPGFLVGVDEGELEELIGNFTIATEVIVAATHAGDVVLAAFFET